MAPRIKRATITIDEIALKLFLADKGYKKFSYTGVLDELQQKLGKLEEDPRYDRVIFAVDGQKKYVEITDRDVSLAGVFPRVSAVRYEYGQDNEGLRSGLSVNIRDTLIVADNDSIAYVWETELAGLGYSIRKLE